MWVFVLKTSGGPHEADLDVLWEAGASGLEEREGEVRAFFARKTDLPLRGAWEEQEERDWQAEWKAGLKPVHAGRITIVPPWLRGDVPEGQLPLIIDVGMAFGTGHHETTRMAVEAIGRLELRGERVLDVGTGSGVLAIAAVLLGASEALGVDLDPVTIPAANENARLNGLGAELDGGRLTFLEGTLSDAQGGPYDVVVANLYAELHDMLMSQYPVVPDGTLILTGILNSKLPVVLAALEREGFAPTETRTDGDWALVVASPR